MSNRTAVILISSVILSWCVITGYIPQALGLMLQERGERLKENSDERGLRIASDALRSNENEENDIRFEILVPEVKWVIPENKPGLETPIKIGIRITNNQKNPLYLGIIDPNTVLFLGIEDSEGKFLPNYGGRDGTFITPKTHPAQIHCSLLAPRQSLTFFLDAKLYWQDDKLILGGSDGLGGVWYFEDIKPGSYKVSFSYVNQRSVDVCFEPGRQTQVVEGLWTGTLRTPSVEIQIIEPLIKSLEELILRSTIAPRKDHSHEGTTFTYSLTHSLKN
jgi:hypothetical protein